MSWFQMYLVSGGDVTQLHRASSGTGDGGTICAPPLRHPRLQCAAGRSADQGRV